MNLAERTFAGPSASGMAAHGAYMAVRRFGSLDGLRFFCIMAVLWHHGSVWTGFDTPVRVATRGFLGVDFFFVLSGYLITTLLLRERRAKGQFSIRRFYWRRILRIVPVYFLVVTAVAGYYIAVKGETQYLELLPFYYLFLSNFLTDHIPMLGPTWSLSVEEQYYMVWPLLLLVLPRRTLMPVLGALVVLNVAAVSGALAPLGIAAFEAGPLAFRMFTATYAPILIGSALAIVLDRAGGFGRLYRLLGRVWSAPMAFAALIAVLQLTPADITGWPGLLIHLTMAACLAAIVMREDHAMAPLLAFRPVARVGEVSYGLYLYHLIGLHIATVALGAAGYQGAWTVLVSYTLISIAMAEVSFRTFERWFQSFKERPLRRMPAPA